MSLPLTCDMASIDALIGALKQYEETLLFISHDVHFIRSIASTVLHIHAGKLTPTRVTSEYYLEKSQASSERDGLVAALQNHPTDRRFHPQGRYGTEDGDEGDPRTAPPGGRTAKAANKAKREQQKKLADFEEEIVRLEARQKYLTEQLDDPSSTRTPARPSS